MEVFGCREYFDLVVPKASRGTGTAGLVSATLGAFINSKAGLEAGIVAPGAVAEYPIAEITRHAAAVATATQASINAATGVATFAAGQGTTLANALTEITARFTAATTSAGEFAFFKVAGTGNEYLFISDGTAGVTANDDLIQLTGVTTIGSINLTGGNLTVLS